MIRIGPLVTAARTSLEGERDGLVRAMNADVVAGLVALLLSVATLFLIAAVLSGPTG